MKDDTLLALYDGAYAPYVVSRIDPERHLLGLQAVAREAERRLLARISAVAEDRLANALADSLRSEDGSGPAKGRPGDGFDEIDILQAEAVRAAILTALEKDQ